jgi:hypothetical protein
MGMTAPRVYAAFLRDKEVTGNYNIQEGFEVLGREGLTGPCMMAVAPLMFMLAAKFGRLTGVNSRLINRYGDSLKELVSSPKFNKELLSKKDSFKEAFYKVNLERMLENTLGKNNTKSESIEFILEQIKKYETAGNKKTRNEMMSAIVEHINELRYASSSELSKLNTVRVGSEAQNNLRDFDIKEAIEGLIKYSDDAIKYNDNLAQLDANMAENIKDSALIKRLVTNISTMLATLGIMSVLPKIYARSEVAPGNVTAMQLKAQQETEVLNADSEVQANEPMSKNTESLEPTFKGRKVDESSSQLTFKGKNDSAMSKFKKWLAGLMKDGWAGELEYNGHHFTNTLMTILSLGGLLAPRGMRAYNRAQVDENGKKDLTELYEILIRDVASSLSVVFLVPMLTRAFVNSYENKSGFVLMNKDRTRTGWDAVKDLLNPYSSSHVLSNTELNSIYNGVNSKEKMMNFCEFITKNEGDLYKILSKSEELPKVVTEHKLNFSLESLKDLSKAERNSKITEFFKGLENDGNLAKDKLDDMIARIMKGTKGANLNKISRFAKGLNSVPAFITTFLISPYVLGWLIPNFTYANTRRLHAKAEEERKQNAQIAVA